jgi:hypothetical protein
LLGQGTHNPGYYHGEAGLVILTLDDGSLQAFSNGVDVTSGLVSSGILTVDTLYDARQAQGGPGEIAVTNIDLALLANSGAWPQNGLIYAAHYGAGTGVDAKGVRLLNGSDLAGPLTVATENSIYVQGDFNTVDKQGAAVIADAVNLLSNNWKDTKTAGGPLPVATPTTYNMAIVSGNTDTVGSVYSGGFENLPRFHEKWDKVDCSITGSFVNTWTSQYANAPWEYDPPYYTAPRRKWAYDTGFNLVANLPPFTPMTVTTEDVAIW